MTAQTIPTTEEFAQATTVQTAPDGLSAYSVKSGWVSIALRFAHPIGTFDVVYHFDKRRWEAICPEGYEVWASVAIDTAERYSGDTVRSLADENRFGRHFAAEEADLDAMIAGETSPALLHRIERTCQCSE